MIPDIQKYLSADISTCLCHIEAIIHPSRIINQNSQQKFSILKAITNKWIGNL